jgi:nucleoside-diphosphate-sugar epimerase
MKILVTGGRGFVGSKIAQHLLDCGNLVYTPSRDELDLLDLMSVHTWFSNNSVDVVVHCALSGREVLSSTDPAFLSDGLIMFRNLWLQKNDYKSLINLGSAYELDLSKNNSLVIEDEFLNHLPPTSYGYAKNLVARIIRETDNFYNLRLFGVFHETEKDNRFLKIVKNRDSVIISNDIYLDYVYLEDIFPVVDRVLSGTCPYKDINVVYNHKYMLSEIAYKLCNILGLSKDRITITNQGSNHLTGDSTKLASLDLPLIGLAEGLRKYR